MSKPVKELIMKSYEAKFKDLNGAVLIGTRGIESNTTNGIRADLSKKGVKITVVQNSLAKKVLAETELAPANDLFNEQSALVYSVDEEVSVVNVARELIEIAKTVKDLQFHGAVMEGITFGPDEIKKLSEYPTKEEAQAQVVQIILTPAQNLVGSIVSPGKKLASIIKTIQEKLESGEEIKKAG